MTDRLLHADRTLPEPVRRVRVSEPNPGRCDGCGSGVPVRTVAVGMDAMPSARVRLCRLCLLTALEALTVALR